MIHDDIQGAPKTTVALSLVVGITLAACTSGSSITTLSEKGGSVPSQASTPALVDVLADIPAETRVASHAGEPRGQAYWISWSTCGENSQADVAAANGGRDAGWYIVDDLIDNPGVAVGEYSLRSCDEAINLMAIRDAAGDARAGSLTYELGSQLLTSELNLSAGAEWCPVLDEVLTAAHMLLAAAAFTGTGSYAGAWDETRAQAASEIVELLEVYNTGELCR